MLISPFHEPTFASKRAGNSRLRSSRTSRRCAGCCRGAPRRRARCAASAREQHSRREHHEHQHEQLARARETADGTTSTTMKLSICRARPRVQSADWRTCKHNIADVAALRVRERSRVCSMLCEGDVQACTRDVRARGGVQHAHRYERRTWRDASVMRS